jgi:CheY-like chemotaxis protein
MTKRPTSIPSADSTLLLVDDDAAHLRALARSLRSNRRSVSVLTAGGAAQAIELLGKMPIDIVLSDLQMPEMDGFELVAWMIHNKPQIPVIAMTAYWSKHAEEKLASLGGIECLTKPLDVTSVIARIDEVLAGGFQGHIQNMSAASLLQIISMDRKTCTLMMGVGDETGQIFIHKGEIVDARSGELRGEAAALKVLGWPYPTITIDSRCKVMERTIERPLTYLIMEAMRLADEEARSIDDSPWSSPEAPRGPSAAAPASEAASNGQAPSNGQVRPGAEPKADPAVARISQVSLSAIKALGLTLVDAEGRILSLAAGTSVDLTAMAQLASSMLRELRTARVGQCGGERVEELVFTASDLCHLIKPLALRDDAFVLLVFNPSDTSLALRRTDVDKLVREIDAEYAGASGRDAASAPPD